MRSSSWRGDALVASLIALCELEDTPDLDDEEVSRRASELILEAKPKLDAAWSEFEESFEKLQKRY